MDSFPSWTTIAISGFGLLVASEAVYHMGSYIHSIITAPQKAREKKKREDTTVLFFPDSQPTCIPFLTGKCVTRNCKFTHQETQFSKLVGHLMGAKKSLDVALYILTNPELTNILCDLEEKGVIIRFIIHNENDDCTFSQSPTLKANGIQVRRNTHTYLMHHKFVIVDGKTLINGSFNWTRQAVFGNNENVLITSDDLIVSKFKQEFNKLWDQFDPDLEFSDDETIFDNVDCDN